MIRLKNQSVDLEKVLKLALKKVGHDHHHNFYGWRAVGDNLKCWHCDLTLEYDRSWGMTARDQVRRAMRSHVAQAFAVDAGIDFESARTLLNMRMAWQQLGFEIKY